MLQWVMADFGQTDFGQCFKGLAESGPNRVLAKTKFAKTKLAKPILANPMWNRLPPPLAPNPDLLTSVKARPVFVCCVLCDVCCELCENFDFGQVGLAKLGLAKVGQSRIGQTRFRPLQWAVTCQSYLGWRDMRHGC